MPDSRDIAVVGVGAMLPGAADAHTFWDHVAAGVDAITSVPEGRWDPVFFDPTSSAVDRVYCNRGGFLPSTPSFDAGAFGIMPVAAEGAEPDQLLSLAVAAATLADAGLDPGHDLRRRTAVILGRGSYVTAGMVRLEQKVRGAQQVVSLVRQLLPGASEPELAALKAALQAQAGVFGPDTAIGLVPNLTASRIANRLDLQGPAYTVDAACASSLLAVEHAVHALREGRINLALAGGVHTTQDITFWSVFAQLGALSRSGTIRPLSADADGLLIGEGVAMVALRRLDEALADGQRVYAVIKGVGSASDGRASSVMVPRVAGQVLALERAWRDSGLDPATVGLVEAHGTATAAGDAAELATLAEVFGPAPGSHRDVVGSVKSMIGHAMPAAGAAGLIKAVLALHHKVLPPTLHCDRPHADLAATRFETRATAAPWTDASGPRRAAVNAFGFGGIDAHTVLEEAPQAQRRRRRPTAPTTGAVALAAESPEALGEALHSGKRRGGSGPWRLALLHTDLKTLKRVDGVLAKGRPWRGRGGIWLTHTPLAATGRVAWLFPGVEPTFDPDITAICEAFDRPVPDWRTDVALEATGMGLVLVGRLLAGILDELGVPAHAYAGHSVGEWSAMIASGLIPRAAIDRFLPSLQAGSLEVPGVQFAAAATDVHTAHEVLAGLPDIAVSHDNCPRQILICGVDASVAEAKRRLIARGVMVQVLPFRSGFHSPLLAPHLAPYTEAMTRLDFAEPTAPVWSATTTRPFPSEPDAVRALATRHLTEPVRFRELIEAMYDDGVRVFVQVGAGSLPGFVADTLGDREHLVVSALDGRRAGLDQLRAMALGLWTEGVDLDLDRLIPRSDARSLPIRLDLRSPLLTAPGPLTSTSAAPVQAPGRVGEALQRSLDAVARAARDVASARPSITPSPRTTTLRLGLDTHPFLHDHAFFPQPEGWSDPADRHPVVPMTMMVQMMAEAAEQAVPGMVATALTDIRAERWLAVHPPVQVQLVATPTGPHTVEVALTDYARATVHLAATHPPAPAPALPPLRDPEPCPHDAGRLYGERWMFHGPEYRGITSLDAWSEQGVDATLTTPAAPGALLDNAGQAFGYWLMIARELDRLALPVSLDRVALFGPHPAAGTPVVCRVRIVEASDTTLTGDLELLVAGEVWCRIDRWSDRRFPNDPHMWRVMRQPEHHLLSDEQGALVVFDEARRRIPSREWITRCFLVAAERDALLAAGPRHQRDHLHTAIAAKDAVRRLWRDTGHGPLFPAEVVLGPHHARVRDDGRTIHLATDVDPHTHVAAALASFDAAPAVGVAAVEGATARLLPHAGPAERDLLGPAPHAGTDPLAARMIAARRAVRPTAWTEAVLDRADADTLVVDGTALHTTADARAALAWTQP